LGAVTLVAVATTFLVTVASARATVHLAHSAAAGTAINGCVSNATGVVRLSPGGRCGKGERSVAWDRAGRKGARGARGAIGPVGLEGGVGAAGAPGATGPQGLAGPTGAAGATGAAGTAGNANTTIGSAGGEGAAGPRGVTGAAGAAGATGVTGAHGPTGANGAGAEGPAGAAGPSGPSGPTGATGPHGPPLPTVLGSGAVEQGVWVAASAEEPQLGNHLTTATITFPVPTASAITAEDAVYVTKAGEQIDAEGVAVSGVCKGSVAAPTAPAAHLCIYTGVESLTDVRYHGILNRLDTPGTQKQGAFLTFEVIEEGSPAIRAQGSWAVTG
jgi:hypothetical protein